jgi:signal transduction histidine kinase
MLSASCLTCPAGPGPNAVRTDDLPALPGDRPGSPGGIGAVGNVITSAAAACLTLDQQLNLLDVLFDRMPVAIVVLDREGRLRRWNKTFQATMDECIGVPPGAAALHPRFLDLYPGNEDAFRPLIAQVLGGETVSRQALRLVIHGAPRYTDVAGAPLVERGDIVGALLVGIDVTDRELACRTLEQRVEERTREVERRRQVAESLRGILAALNSSRTLNQILDYIAAEACQVLAADAVAVYRFNDGLFRIQVARGLDVDYVQRMFLCPGEGPLGRAVEARQPVAVTDIPSEMFRLPGLREDPVRRPLVDRLAEQYPAALAVPLVVKGEAYGGLMLYYARRPTFSDEELGLAATFGDQAALALENAKLRDQRTKAAAAAERSRLARDLHDAVTQTLFSASLMADVLPRLWERAPAEGRRCLDDLRGLTRAALAEMRSLLVELRPAALEEAKLDFLLHQLAQAVTGRARCSVTASVAEAPPLPSDVQVALYRIAQEALNNAARHARASRVDITLRALSQGVELQITDDGRGFDAACVSSDHLGLGIMRERADAIGGVLTIESERTRGTVVTVKWPRADAPWRRPTASAS